MSQAPVFTALVVDDHPLMRQSLVAALAGLGATRVLEAATVQEARAIANWPHDDGALDLALIDLRLPDGLGLTLIAELRALGWPRVVVVSASDEPHEVHAAFAAGADGYLLKSAPPAVVNEGLRAVLNGAVYADPSVASLLAAGLQLPVRVAPPDLSDGERELLSLVAAGKSNNEIARHLIVPPLTVKTRLARIGRRLGTGDRSEMVARAMRLGIVR